VDIAVPNAFAVRRRALFAAFNPASFLLGGMATLLVVWAASTFRLARVVDDAMAPAYMSGDVVLVSSRDYGDLQLTRGDVELLNHPLYPDRSLVSRVIGLQGDTVQIFDGQVYVNDVPVADDSYVLAAYRSHDDWGPLVTPQGYCFVIGDHRNVSRDSRHWGFVPRRYLSGRVVARVWPRR
jgi:signal peptidase I